MPRCGPRRTLGWRRCSSTMPAPRPIWSIGAPRCRPTPCTQPSAGLWATRSRRCWRHEISPPDPRAPEERPVALAADDLAHVDVASPKVYARGVPHDTLAALRRYDPVHWHPWPGTRGGFWLLSKHADVVTT